MAAEAGVQQSSRGMDMKEKNLDRLAGVMLERAKKRMEEAGKFYPFGVAINGHGEVVEVNYNSPGQGTRVQEILDHVETRLAAGAKGGEFVAAGICLLGMAHVPPDKRVSEAVCLQLYEPGESVNLYLPYENKEQKVKYGELFRTPGRGNLFKG